MGDFDKQICRLCLVISPTCECETIDEIKREILQVLQINMDFDVSNCAVACNTCLERLQDCFDFKSRIITTLMDDIKKTSQREIIGENLCLEKFQVCQLCTSLIKEEAYNYSTDMKSAVLLEDMIRNCFPEVDLNTHVHESHICKQCVSSLERHYEFKKCCQEVEQKVVHFLQVMGHCITDKLNLDDMLKFKDYDMLGTPLIIKKECSDAENVDENATKCPKGEDIANIKCEEIHIKDELDSGKKSTDCNSSEGSRFSKEATETRTSASKGQAYSCHKCHYSSDRSYHMKRHMLTHSDNEVHVCTLCSFMTNTKLSLQAHMTSHRGSIKSYCCPQCTYETDHKSTIDKHILKHKDNSEAKMYKCDLCPLKTRYKNVLRRHLKMLHKDPQEIPKYRCKVCNHESKYKACIASHMQTHKIHKVAYKFQCEKCSFKTKWKGSLERHVTVTHEDPNVAYKFQCEICPFKTKEKGNLNRHLMIHSIKHLYSCDQCTYSSNFKGSLAKHQLNRHTDGERQIYKCKLCTYQARTTRSISFHMIKAHTDPSQVPNLKCPHCPHETVYKHSLLRHIRRIHTIENKPKLKCDLCNYKTPGMKLMRQHLNMHREATIQCYQCDFLTKWKSSLRKHMKLHQVGSYCPLKQQTISLRSRKNGNMKKSDDKKRIDR